MAVFFKSVATIEKVDPKGFVSEIQNVPTIYFSAIIFYFFHKTECNMILTIIRTLEQML